MARTTLVYLCDELEVQRLKESAALYAELYEDDVELQELTETALTGWLNERIETGAGFDLDPALSRLTHT